jgi:cytochrome P450
MFGRKILLVMNPKHITEILSTSSEHQLRGLKPASEAFFGKKVLFVLHGREWMDLRKLMKASLTNASLKLAEIDISIVAAKMVNVLTPYANAKKGARNQMATDRLTFFISLLHVGCPVLPLFLSSSQKLICCN